MFTYFTDRDGKYQLGALRESAFDPLARTCDFMLKEEAHHMFVGNSGISRVVQRTAELMRHHDTDDLRPHGGLDLRLLQRYLNFHYAVSLDLFGSEASTNAASYYASGLKGRMNEDRYDDDHVLVGGELTLDVVEDGRLRAKVFPALNVVNQMLRLDYVEDCQKGVERWNRVLEDAGIDFRFRLPHQAFGRQVGFYAGAPATPDGVLVDDATYQAGLGEWLPTGADRAYVASLMQPCLEPGRMAGWIAPPSQGINGKPVDYTYVQL
jgi:benzoyl-CoA 2,3-dioxygenase component B